MDWITPRVCRRAGMPACLALVVFLSPGVSRGQTPPDTAPPGEAIRVARLIKDLGNDDFAVRRSATQHLAKLGAGSRAQLEAALADADPEVRLRAGQLLEKLQLDELWAPSTVTLHTTDLRASQVLVELARMTGNHVHVGDPYGTFAEQTIEVNYDGLSYWEAVDDVCRRTGNRVRPHYDMHTPGIVVSSGSPGNYPRAYSGPVRAQLTSAKRHFVEELNYEEPKSELTHSFHIGVQFNWEDRFHIVGYATQPELVEGVTDNHVIISAAQPTGGGWNATSRGLRQVTANMKLNPIPVSAAQLDVLTIRWGLIAIGEPSAVEITDFAPDRQHTRDDVAVEIETFEKQNDGKYVATLMVRRDLAMPDPQEIVFREYEAELVDQQGQPFHVHSVTPSISDRGVQMRITFHGASAQSEPQTLKLHYPRLRARRDVYLTFKNVPLPVGKPE